MVHFTSDRQAMNDQRKCPAKQAMLLHATFASLGNEASVAGRDTLFCPQKIQQIEPPQMLSLALPTPLLVVEHG